jgi:hypothetical protein
MGGGIGSPSATNTVAMDEGGFGIGGGIGSPSATNGLMADDGGFGMGGGIGSPSARSARSIKVVLLVVLLTEEIAGSTIRRVKVQTARTSAIFFKDVALLAGIIRGRILGGLLG